MWHPSYERNDRVEKGEKIFSRAADFPLTAPIPNKVFQNYDQLDGLARRQGYSATEVSADQSYVSTGLMVGLGNNRMHSGWIATIDDEGQGVKAADQLRALNEKIGMLTGYFFEGGKFTPMKSRYTEDVLVIVGFAQTGTFSIGYTIYTKHKARSLRKALEDSGAFEGLR